MMNKRRKIDLVLLAVVCMFVVLWGIWNSLAKKREIRDCLEKIKSDSWTIREDGVSGLGDFHYRNAETIQALLSTLRDFSPKVREAATMSIGKLVAKGAIPTLRAMLSSEKNILVLHAVYKTLKTLDWQPQSKIEKFKWLAAGQQWDELGRAGVLENGDGVESLLRILKSKDAKEKNLAIRATGTYKIKSALPALVDALSEYQTRDAALMAMTDIGNNQANTSVFNYLQNKKFNFFNRLFPEVLLRNLIAHMGNSLEDLFQQPFFLENCEWRLLAISILSAMKSDQSAIVLNRFLYDPVPWVREKTAEAVGERRIKDSIGALQRLLRDPFFWVRRKAALALGKIGDLAAAGGLREAASDPVWLVRSAAENALQKIGEKIKSNYPAGKHVAANPRYSVNVKKGQPVPKQLTAFIQQSYGEWLRIWKQPGLSAFKCIGQSSIKRNFTRPEDLTIDEKDNCQSKYCLIFSPDYKKALDLMRGHYLIGNRPALDSGEDCSEVHLIEIEHQKRSQALYIGTNGRFDDAVWLNNDCFFVVGWVEAEGAGKSMMPGILPLLYYFNLSRNLQIAFAGMAISIHAKDYNQFQSKLNEWREKRLIKY